MWVRLRALGLWVRAFCVLPIVLVADYIAWQGVGGALTAPGWWSNLFVLLRLFIAASVTIRAAPLLIAPLARPRLLIVFTRASRVALVVLMIAFAAGVWSSFSAPQPTSTCCQHNITFSNDPNSPIHDFNDVANVLKTVSDSL